MGAPRDTRGPQFRPPCFAQNIIMGLKILNRPPSLNNSNQNFRKVHLTNEYFYHHFSGAIREEVKSKAGSQVDLPCMINQADCGDFHSIKWYKENRRVYVYR